jgi:hypothetical protein
MDSEVREAGAALPSVVGQDPNRERTIKADALKGRVVKIDAKDKLEFVGPEGKAWAIVQSQIERDVDEIHRVTHTMANSIAANETVKSGIAKLTDNKAEEVVLTAYAKVVKDFILNVYAVIAAGRNENIAWKILGLDSYKIPDKEFILEQVKTYGQVPSPTLKKLIYLGMASDSVDIPPNQMDDIANEINEAVSAMDAEQLVQNPADIMAAKVATDNAKNNNKPAKKSASKNKGI